MKADPAGPALVAERRTGWWGSSPGALATLSVAGGFVLWELVGRFLIRNALFLATPSETIVALVELIRINAADVVRLEDSGVQRRRV